MIAIKHCLYLCSFLQPDSQKSTSEQMKDKAKELYESAAAKMQPEVYSSLCTLKRCLFSTCQSEKSNFQKAADASSGNTSERTVYLFKILSNTSFIVVRFSGTLQRHHEERYGWRWRGAAVKDFLNLLRNP